MTDVELGPLIMGGKKMASVVTTHCSISLEEVFLSISPSSVCSPFSGFLY